MRLLVMGAGALGAYFGARLQADGHEVTYVARGAHLDAMRRDGLRVESRAGDLHLPEVHATDDPGEAGPVDVVFFAVKNYDVETAGRQLAPALTPDTIVVTTQNGVGAPDRLAAVIGPERVHPGAVYMPADIRAPGIVRHPAPFHRLAFGPMTGAPGPVATRFADAVRASGPDCDIPDDIRAMLWEKFVLLASVSALTCLARTNIGPIREIPGTAELLRQAVDEAAAVGRADCPGLRPDVADAVWQLINERLTHDMHASMLDDLERGRRIEIDYLSGDIARIGARHGVPAPLHALVAKVLQPFRDGPPA